MSQSQEGNSFDKHDLDDQPTADRPWPSISTESWTQPCEQLHQKPRSISLPQAFVAHIEDPATDTIAPGSKKRARARAIHAVNSPLSLPPPVYKRRRLYGACRPLPNRNFPPNPTRPNQPPSPLFFSHNAKRERPALHPRFSSSEAGARMLSGTHHQESLVRTVSLARASLNDSAPAAATSMPRRLSLHRSHTGASSGYAESSESPRELADVGITELLEQDARPTFILDLNEATNLTTGFLRILYANPALKSNSAWPEMIEGRKIDAGGISNPAGRSPGSPGSMKYGQFKKWLLSAAPQDESLDTHVPSFLYGDIVWSCSTIRTRYRVVIASTILFSTPSRPHSSASASVPSKNSGPLPGHRGKSSAPVEAIDKEPSDYFGVEVAATYPDARSQAQPSSPKPLPLMQTFSPGSSPVNARRDGNGATATSYILASMDSRPSLAAELVLADSVASQIDPFSYNSTSSLRLPSRTSPLASPDQSSHPVESHGFFDWTRLTLSHDLPPHIQFARSVDWSTTALGPIDKWSADLRQMCNLIMASPHPAAMYWGEDLVAIYNEAYVLLAGQKHPRLMGQSYREAWAEIWEDVKDVFASARQTGEATMKDDDCLFIRRSDFLEETYFSWSIIPIVGGDGSVTGLYNPAFEKTRRKIAERRMLTLREVGERTATARDVKAFWHEVSFALESNEFDTPFVLLYSVSDDSESDSSSIHSNSLIGSKLYTLEGSLGVPPGHPAAPTTNDLKDGMEGFVPIFREVVKLDRPMLLDVVFPDGRPMPSEDQVHSSSDGGGIPHAGTAQIPAGMLEGIQWRGFNDPCRSVVVCPVHPTTGESTLGFLVLGVNPRRPYDDDYHLFIQLLSRQLATSLASVVLFEEEIKRGRKAAQLAALDRIELSQQLAARTQEARDIETRFTRMAEFSPAGLFIADRAGHITYCNDTWYEITRVPKNQRSTDRWIDAVKEEDQELVRNRWHDLIHNVRPVEFEFRFKAPWEDRGNKSDTWVLFSAYPEKYTEDVLDPCQGGKIVSSEGSLKSVFGSVTNISQQKWAEDFQKRKMQEAVELKRQQENFIDITSHEMRNPLSAILQCADEIASTLSAYRHQKRATTTIDASAQLKETLDSSIDAAQTITLCAQHQKRIVDDVLTMSKLDSALLMVTPVDVRPVEVVQRALKMFEGEVATANIDMDFKVDPSIHRLGIDWIRVDPSRVLQVLINLTTNAIKFTSREGDGKKRRIGVTIAASLQRPSKLPSSQRSVDYFPARSSHRNALSSPDWGNGEEVYVNFDVEDTGRGLTDDEKKTLFLRFSQASPRTHVKYGGSGLGLFISRELTELQGGEIGVRSEAGKGSTFAFYVKARRSNTPVDSETQPHASNPTSHDSKGKCATVAPGKKARDFAADDGAPAIPRARLHNEIKVLIVEDNLVNQRVLQKQLKNAGFIVSVANHGGEALDVLRESVYWKDNATILAELKADPQKRTDANVESIRDLNVVLMDQEMPVMDGVTCTKTIRKWEAAGDLVRHVPIIAVTANARQEQIEELLAAGMDDVVSKPFRIPELIPKIEELADANTADTSTDPRLRESERSPAS